MSREVRRVPVDWQHPLKFNPYWLPQANNRVRQGLPESRLHGVQEQFAPLHRASVSVAAEEWDRELAEWEAGTHEHLVWLLGYHSTDGYEDRNGTVNFYPYEVYADDGETVVRSFHPTSTAEIRDVYPYSDYAGPRPSLETHMPDFPADAPLGWCLYETVSEGCPTTPVFATAEELIDHLATVGEDYKQQPYRRSAAESLVGQGSSFGSLMVVGGVVYSGSEDADILADRLAR